MVFAFRLRHEQITNSTQDLGTRAVVVGNTLVSICEREGTDADGIYPITPSTQMGEQWAEAAAVGYLNISGRPLIFIEPEGEHAAVGKRQTYVLNIGARAMTKATLNVHAGHDD